MGDEYNDISKVEDESKTKKLTISRAFCIVLKYLFLDVIIHGCIFPIIGTYFCGAFVHYFLLKGQWEFVSTVVVTFFLVTAGINVFFDEFSFWKHLLGMEPFHRNLLMIRDLINFATLITSIIYIHSTTETMISSSYTMKNSYLTDGVGYFFMKTVFLWLHIDLSYIDNLGLKSHGQSLGANSSNNEHDLGAEYIYYWAVFAACVAKLLYFNTLFCMLRTVHVFLSLKPKFFEDDEYDDAVLGEAYQSINFDGVADTIVNHRGSKKLEDDVAEADAVATYVS